MRLLLDEHLSPEIARQLREKGHDVVAVQEYPGLVGRADRVHFAATVDERRVIVTRDLGDFRPLLSDAIRNGTTTYGLICVGARFSLSRNGIAQIVTRLEELLVLYPEEDAAVKRGGELWL